MKRFSSSLLFCVLILACIPLAHADLLITFESDLFRSGFASASGFWLNATSGNRTALIIYNTTASQAYEVPTGSPYEWSAVYFLSATFGSEMSCYDGFYRNATSDTNIGSFYYRYCSGLKTNSDLFPSYSGTTPELYVDMTNWGWFNFFLGLLGPVFIFLSWFFLLKYWKEKEYVKSIVVWSSFICVGIGFFFVWVGG